MIMVHMEDITERKQVEKRLRESENTFTRIFQGSPVALTLVSALDGKFVDVNDAFISGPGYNRDEVIGKDIRRPGNFCTMRLSVTNWPPRSGTIT